jgi:branched-chain amino acid transport system substrate-binding protein
LGCSQSYDDSKKERKNRALNSKGTIVIGVAWPKDENKSFVEGALLAMEEINSNKGIRMLNNRPLQLLINRDEKTVPDSLHKKRELQRIALDVANSFADNLDVIAVIGHQLSTLAVPASIVYQYHGIVFLAPTSTNINLTTHNFDYVFRMHPNNEEMGEQLAAYCDNKGYKKIVILQELRDYSTELADSFISHAEKKGIKIVKRSSFFTKKDNFTDIMVQLKRLDKQFDAFFVSAVGEVATKIYQESRDMNFMLPFVGGETLNSDTFWKVVKLWEYSDEITKKSAVPTVFNEFDPITRTFIEKFKRKYGEQADYKAALGYDAVKLLEHAIKTAKSTEPYKIAEILRYMLPCNGVSGRYWFKINGDVIPKKLHFKSFRRGGFEYETFDDQSPNTKKWSDLELCGNVDRDRDGIPNNIDACPDNTPEEISKDVHKNGILRGCPVDTDQDSVPDYQDVCFENSTEEISKGVYQQGAFFGCPIDGDQDGVLDYQDDCPKNSRDELKKGVDSRGCPLDSDKDAVLDHKEVCIDNSPAEIAKGVYQQKGHLGCPIDSEGDGVPDYRDDCPKNRPLKSEKRIKIVSQIIRNLCYDNTQKERAKGIYQQGAQIGCPMDSDNDGVLDYRDDCPKNSRHEKRC